MTKQEMIDEAVDSMFSVPTTTRVVCWGFKFDGKFYQVANFWLPPVGEHIAVYSANKKGKRLENKPILQIINSKDFVAGVEKLADLLYPEEPNQNS